jgi:hypothetical protein
LRRATALIAALGLALVSIATGSAFIPVPPSVNGVVSGGIVPCSALPSPDSPRYAAGTVTVLKGQVGWASTGSGNAVNILPATVVARERVVTDATYWFELPPGQYVLEANEAQYASVTVHAGDNLSVDIPNPCI